MLKRYNKNVEIRELAQSNSLNDRIQAARMLSRDSPIVFFDLLQRDKHEEVREALLVPSTPSGILERLTNDESSEIGIQAIDILRNNIDVLVTNFIAIYRKEALWDEVSKRLVNATGFSLALVTGMLESTHGWPLKMHLSIPKVASEGLLSSYFAGTAYGLLNNIFGAASLIRPIVNGITDPFQKLHNTVIKQRNAIVKRIEEEAHRSTMAAKFELFLAVFYTDPHKALRLLKSGSRKLEYSLRLGEDLEFMYFEEERAREKAQSRLDRENKLMGTLIKPQDLMQLFNLFLTKQRLGKFLENLEKDPSDKNKEEEKK